MLKSSAAKLLAVVLSLPICMIAQTTTGEIVGAVTDTSNSGVPAAIVTVTNVATNIVAKFTSDATGNYVATPLLIGRYSVAVEAKGFKKSIVPSVSVNVQDRIRVDFQLQVGELAETVQVQSAAPLLEADTSSLGQVVDSQRIVDLPLNGRFFTRLAVLTAGAAPTPSGALDASTGGFSSNGVRPYQNDFILDGVDNNSMSPDLASQSTFVIGPAPDAISEFRLQTSSMSAEFGRSGAAVLNVNIKSGSNQLHGTAFEFLRNSKLDAKNYFDSGSAPIPPFKQNQFGFSVGGPIWLPKLYDGHNRTFFFFDYQGTRIRSSQTALITVPPDAWRHGDFSGFQTIYNPATTVINADGSATRQPFANNKIPMSMFDPVALQLINSFPEPNVPGNVSISGVSNNYLTNPSTATNVNQWDARIDHRISDKDSLFGRFSFSNRNSDSDGPIPPPLDSGEFGANHYINYSRSVAFSETHIFTPTLVNELRLGYNRARIEVLQFNSNQNVSAQFNIPGIPFSPGYGGLPFFDIEDLTVFGSSLYLPTIEYQNVYQVVDSLSWVKGRHALKFGAEVRPKVDIPFSQPPQARGSFGFSGNATRDPNNLSNTGLGTADFLLGKSYDQAGLTAISSIIYDHFQQPGYFLYGQDDFKVSKKLTLNLGLRYEFVTHASEKYNAMANFLRGTDTLQIVKGRNDPLPPTFYPQIKVTRDAPATLVPNNKLDFMPRVGFAYSLTPKTVLRGGYGIFYSSYEVGPLSIPNPGNNPPFYAQTLFFAPSVTTPNPIVNQLSQGFPADALSNPSSFTLFSLDPKFKNPYVQQFNFSVQREIGWNSVLDISYAGSKGTRLYEYRPGNEAAPSADPNSDINARRPFPFIPTGFQYWCSCGSSTYHSLQAKIEKRLSNGLSFLGAYTFAKAIDEQSSASLGFLFFSSQSSPGGSFRDARYPQEEKGPADFDVRHRFVYSMSYAVPFGRGKAFGANVNPVVNALVGGWELQTVTSLQTGGPRTVVANIGVSNADGENRPDAIVGVSSVPDHQGPSNWINANAFTEAQPGTFGNVGRNTITGAGIISVDLSAFKDFSIREQAKLQFRGEFFNLPNHPNFQVYSLNTTWGQSSFGQYSAAAPSRQIQLALKLIF
jgi:carboxypeptidase family protein/TonB-dependent receptor-like protein